MRRVDRPFARVVIQPDAARPRVASSSLAGAVPAARAAPRSAGPPSSTTCLARPASPRRAALARPHASAGTTRAWTTANATPWRPSGTSCRCSSRSTRSPSRSPTRQPARAHAFRRRRRTLSQPRPAPATRLLALSGRPRSGHRDVVRRQRLVGPRVHRSLPRDRHAPLPAGRRAGAALHRRRRLGPAAAAGSGGTPTIRTRPARRSPRARCSRRSSTRRRTPASRSRRPKFLALGQHERLQPAKGLYAASNLNPTPDRLHRGAADLRPGAAVPPHRRTQSECERAAAADGVALQRFGYLLDFSPQYDAIYLQWMLALYALEGDPTLYRSPPTTPATPQTRAAQRRRPLPALLERRNPAQQRRRSRGCCRRRPPRPACSRGWPCTRRRPAAPARCELAHAGPQTPSARRATRSNTRSGSSRFAISIALASLPTT